MYLYMCGLYMCVYACIKLQLQEFLIVTWLVFFRYGVDVLSAFLTSL